MKATDKLAMSVIAEEDIEHTIKMQRRRLTDDE
jgi:hypothetical protein